MDEVVASVMRTAAWNYRAEAEAAGRTRRGVGTWIADTM